MAGLWQSYKITSVNTGRAVKGLRIWWCIPFNPFFSPIFGQITTNFHVRIWHLSAGDQLSLAKRTRALNSHHIVVFAWIWCYHPSLLSLFHIYCNHFRRENRGAKVHLFRLIYVMHRCAIMESLNFTALFSLLDKEKQQMLLSQAAFSSKSNPNPRKGSGTGRISAGFTCPTIWRKTGTSSKQLYYRRVVGAHWESPHCCPERLFCIVYI